MRGAALGQLSLRLDAVYCIGVGLALMLAALLAVEPTGMPVPLLLGLGGLTAAWGCLVWWLRSRRPLRWTLRLVMTANIVASGALALVGVAAGVVVLAISAVAVSVDVAAFAVSQGVALRRLKGARPTP